MKNLFLILVFMIGVSPSSFGQAPKPTNPNAAIEQELRKTVRSERSSIPRQKETRPRPVWSNENPNYCVSDAQAG